MGTSIYDYEPGTIVTVLLLGLVRLSHSYGHCKTSLSCSHTIVSTYFVSLTATNTVRQAYDVHTS